MNIVFNVFRELNYVLKDEFIVEHKIDDNSVMEITVNALISKENDSQVFLVANCDNKLLKFVVEGNLVKDIALRFRKKEYHRAEMDKNTSLLLISKYDADEEVDTSSKVKIEDDPYYFKKYVFSYTDVGLENATAWINEKKGKDTLVTLIQGYITDTERFARYKENCVNEPIYTYFIELVTKIHCFPMQIVETKNINSTNYFLNQEIDKVRTRSRKPVNIDKIKIIEFVEKEIDYSDIESVCNCWNESLRAESEDKE